ncbi:hypothetical protein Tco_0466301 [Tanacetum coccineum]
MMSESSKASVVPKFEMHVHVSILSLTELEDAIEMYGIRRDLHPRLPNPELTMDKLHTDAIGVYVEQFEQCVNRVTMFELHCRSLNTGKRANKCFKEITSSPKGWKKKFFLIDRRAIPDAMAWRHRDTDVLDEFPISYNEDNADLVAEKIIPLRKPPQSLLYMTGLTTVYHRYDSPHIPRDSEEQDTSFSLSITVDGEAVVSKVDPHPEDQQPPKRIVDPLPPNAATQKKTPYQLNIEKPDLKIIEAREKKEQQALLKAKAKIPIICTIRPPDPLHYTGRISFGRDMPDQGEQ